MILVKNLSFLFKEKRLFNNFSFVIPENSFVTITGESGKGKTTLLNILSGFEKPLSGEIMFDNLVLNKENMPLIRKEIAWLPQNFNIPIETVKELFMAPFNLKINKKNIPIFEEIQILFNRLNIGDVSLSKKIDEISGGQKQRIIIASLLATKKKYFFLDEPTSALDDYSIEILMNILKTEKKTVVIASHNKKVIDSSSQIIDLDRIN